MAPFGRRGALPTQAFLSRSQHEDYKQQPWGSYLARQLKSSSQNSAESQSREGFLPLPIPSCNMNNQLCAATMVAVPHYPVLLGHVNASAIPSGYIISNCTVQTPAASNHTTEAPSATDAIIGRVWRLAQDPQGSREVQRVVEQAEAACSADSGIQNSSKAFDEIATELRGHVSEAMRCPHANFVLQKCISAAAPNAAHLFLEELLQEGPDSVSQAARHRFGCRVIERFLEVCDQELVAPLADCILEDALSLFTHPYGNYTMQHLLAHGQNRHRHRLAELLQANAAEIGSNFYGSAVVGQALKYLSHEDGVALAESLLQVPGLLVSMARSKHGHTAARLAMQALDGPGRVAARRDFCVESSAPCASHRKTMAEA